MNQIKPYTLKGFTLMELLIVLLLFSLIVSMGLVVANLVKSNFNQLTQSQLHLVNLQDRDMKLSSFFLDSDSLVYDPTSQQINSNNRGEVIINKDYIVDKTTNHPIFDSVFDLTLTWISNKTNQKLLTGLFFSCKLNHQTLPFSYHKEYDVATKLHYPFQDSLSIK